MNARFYSPTSGRFLTADTLIPSPTNPQSANRYSYVLGNPIRLIDPSGHVPNQNGWHDRHIGLQNQMQYAVWLIDSLSVNPNVILSTASGYASTAAPVGAAIVGTTWAIAGALGGALPGLLGGGPPGALVGAAGGAALLGSIGMAVGGAVYGTGGAALGTMVGWQESQKLEGIKDGFTRIQQAFTSHLSVNSKGNLQFRFDVADANLGDTLLITGLDFAVVRETWCISCQNELTITVNFGSVRSPLIIKIGNLTDATIQLLEEMLSAAEMLPAYSITE